jgi:hypothetical protein
VAQVLLVLKLSVEDALRYFTYLFVYYAASVCNYEFNYFRSSFLMSHGGLHAKGRSYNLDKYIISLYSLGS